MKPSIMHVTKNVFNQDRITPETSDSVIVIWKHSELVGVMISAEMWNFLSDYKINENLYQGTPHPAMYRKSAKKTPLVTAHEKVDNTSLLPCFTE